MRECWKQAGLILLNTVMVWAVMTVSLLLLNTYPQVLMLHPGDFEGARSNWRSWRWRPMPRA